MAESLTNEMPLRLGSAEDCARVVAALREADFSEETICRTLHLNDMSDVGAAASGNTDLSGVDPRLALLIRVFLFFETVPRSELEMLLGSSTLDSFLNLDILRPVDERTSNQYYTSVFLYPVAQLYIASDRPVDLNGLPSEPEDWVFPAIFEGTLKFLHLLINSPADEALDLCAGSGVAALVLSRTSRCAVSVDITARATHFARFNRILNQCLNAEILQGDLYSAVEGRTFDRIVAHPPFVPALHDQLTYRDGGETGEYLVRRIIEGLPRYLRAGGTYLALSRNIDTDDAPFEKRARQWLGEAQDEFDLIFAVDNEKSPEAVIQHIAERDASLSVEDMARMRQAFEGIKATSFPYGALFIRRRQPDERGEPYTLRTELTDSITGADFEEALRTRSWAAPDEMNTQQELSES